MTIFGKLILKLACLFIPFVSLSLVLHEGGSGGGIGGGSYDLSGLVYGLLLFATVILWLIWILISYALSKDAINKKLHQMLLLFGVIALIAAWFITPRMF